VNHAARTRPGLPRHLALLAVAGWLGACSEAPVERLAAAPAAPTELRIALQPVPGDGELEQQLRRAQDAVRERLDVPRLERLATLFLAKARGGGDPGYYTTAEACAAVMAGQPHGEHPALLLRGHVRHALHDFATAETIARRLVGERGLFLDFGLLGDVLLDRGQLDAAREAYQRMLELKPCLQSYARAAHLRWLIGDLAGSRELLGLAATAGSRRDPESLAWVLARRAFLELQAGDLATAARDADAALVQVADHPQARAMRGRIALAAGDPRTAIEHLNKAVTGQPLPEYLWALADALHTAGSHADATAIEAELLRTGEREDPRTFAAWLATTDREPTLALRLANAEFAQRQDAHTLAVLAIARLRTGDLVGADEVMQRALAVGVVDARLRLQAALVASRTGTRQRVLEHLDAADRGRTALLPSEQALLEALRRAA
jgi:tetratricopeptide (TPR) repeat protein